MKLHRHLLVEAINQRTKSISDPKLLAQEIAAYLLTENLVTDLEPLLRDLIQHRIDEGNVEATLVSAHDLTDEVTKDVKKILAEHYPSAKKISINSKVNPEIVGGVRLVMPNEQLDLTVLRKLSSFKSHVMAGKK